MKDNIKSIAKFIDAINKKVSQDGDDLPEETVDDLLEKKERLQHDMDSIVSATPIDTEVGASVKPVIQAEKDSVKSTKDTINDFIKTIDEKITSEKDPVTKDALMKKRERLQLLLDTTGRPSNPFLNMDADGLISVDPAIATTDPDSKPTQSLAAEKAQISNTADNLIEAIDYKITTASEDIPLA